MAYDEKLAEKIRQSLAHLPDVQEKKMFGGVAFMVNEKMCVTAGDDEMMCRIDPAIREEVIQKKGCRTMIMKGREYKGYVLISKEGMKTEKDFEFWIGLSLDFNKDAKASKKKKK